MVNVAELHGAPIIVFLHVGPYSIGRQSYALLLTLSSRSAVRSSSGDSTSTRSLPRHFHLLQLRYPASASVGCSLARPHN